MSATTSLEPTVLEVAAGGVGAVRLRIRNSGAIVDRFDVTPVGPAAPWISVDPASTSLFPGQEATVSVRFAPPRAPTVRAATLPFGLRVVPAGNPAGSSVEEGRVTVLPFTEPHAEIAPQTSRGTRGGKHEVVVANRGNTPATAVVTATDPDRLLSFSITPDRVTLEPGAKATVLVEAVPHDTFMRGPKRLIPFAVEVAVGDAPPVVLRAALNQSGIVPGWVLPAAGVAGVAIVASLVLPGLLRSEPGGGGGGTRTAPPTTAPSVPPSEAPSVSVLPSASSSDGAGGPSANPSDGPVTPTAPVARIVVGDLQLEDRANEGAVNPSFVVVSDGPGAFVVALDRIVDFSPDKAGVTVCVAQQTQRARCEDMNERGIFQLETRRDGTTTWTITVQPKEDDYPPVVSLGFEFNAVRPALEYRDDSRFDGTQTSGFTALVTARDAGVLDLTAEFNDYVYYAWSIQDTTVIASPPPLIPQGPGAVFALPPTGLTPGKTYALTFRGMSSQLDRVVWSAVVSWR